MSNLNPWIALLLGILIGWLLEWLLELWFFRRRRLACQQELERMTVERDSLRREVDLKTAEVGRLTAAASAAASGVAASLAAPAAAVDLPDVDFDADLPDVDLDAPDLDVDLPEVDLQAPDLDVEIEKPGIDLPDVDLKAGLAGIGAGIAAGFGKLKAKLPDVDLDAPDLSVDLPDVDLSAPAVDVDLPDVDLQAPDLDVDLSAPTVEVDLPEVDLSTAAIALDLPDAVVDTPALSLALTRGGGDDLTRISGIGPKFAATLGAAGITTFAQLAASDRAALQGVVAAPAWRKVDYDEWIVQAQAFAAAPVPVHSEDDLTLLEGIGPKYAAQLREQGITTFAALAAADEATLAGIIAAPAWRRLSYGDWIAQARLAAAGDAAGLAEMQAILHARSGDNLTLIAGLGDKGAEALAAAGIDSYGALAAATPDQLAGIYSAAGLRSADFAAWIAEAELRAAGKRVSHPKRSRSQSAGVLFSQPASAFIAACPQDLSAVKGIGAVYEAKLYAAGIGTYWELANAADDLLAALFEIKDFQNVDFSAIKAGAQQLAEETNSVGRTWSGAQPDDFETLEGIGEVYERRLYEAGICTWQALAATTVEQLAEICHAPEWRRPDYARWIAQARAHLSEA